MTPEEKVDELYDRVFDLKDKLFYRERMEEIVRDLLLHSSLSIRETEDIFYYLNKPNNNIKEINYE